MNDRSPLTQKAELRRSLLTTRRAMTPQEWREKSQQLCDRLQLCPQFTQAQTVLAYFSTRQEPDLSPLFTLSKTWAFPRCVETSLIWHVWSPQSDLALNPGAYGIPEPPATADTVTAAQVDLILVPAVACDDQGYRLGYGGGYYDRLLSLPDWSQKPTIGVVFEFARLPKLPIDPWDRPLQAVCTEAGFFPCHPSR